MSSSLYNAFRSWKALSFFTVTIACALVPAFVHNDYLLQVFFRIVLFAALGLAWNLVGGYAGQLSLGHVAFFGLGAYGLAMFTARGVPVWISIFLAAAVAVVFAAIIGRIVFRLRSPRSLSAKCCAWAQPTCIRPAGPSD
jgi:branched-chain amino acid transport system permease protein